MLRNRINSTAPVVWLALALLSPSLACAAVHGDGGRAAAAQGISDCRKITVSSERLACYDKAADAFDQAQAQGDVVVVDREQVRAVRRQSFGFNIPSINFFSHGKDEPVTNITVKLASADTSAQGRWVMTTVDNSVWRQTDSEAPHADPHAGSEVVIRQGLLGSFFCKIDGQPAVRCVRDR